MFVVAATVAAFATTVFAQGTATADAFIPLASKHFAYNALPYKADPGTGDRGPQSGYNICNSTTEGPKSMCQTAYLNSAADFCLWGPPVPGSQVGDTEGEAVAWCTKPGHGTRIIPSGAITGVQFMKTPDYVQVTGFIQQALIDMDPEDGGGEMDPHGADQRGNPIGGLVYSNAFGGAGYTQAIEWHNFMGSGVFCFKACDPAGKDAANYCQHIYDRIGCQYNAPAAYVDNVFESCLGDSQDFPGIYTGADGVVTTFHQPAESLGPISTMPYDARIPASSQCTTYSSAGLYTGQPAPTAALTTSVAVATTAASVTAIKTVAVTSAKTAATTSASSAAGVPVKLTGNGVWSIAVGVVGVAIGAVVAL